MEALKQPTLRVAAVIAEGVPEQDTKQLIAYAQKHNKVILGPATVGDMQACLRLPFPCEISWVCSCKERATKIRMQGTENARNDWNQPRTHHVLLCL